jgi:hypothetical protein
MPELIINATRVFELGLAKAFALMPSAFTSLMKPWVNLFKQPLCVRKWTHFSGLAEIMRIWNFVQVFPILFADSITFHFVIDDDGLVSRIAV